MRPTPYLALAVATSVAQAALCQSAIISELMAKNASTLADADGDFSDWIEVYNPGPSQADLTGWYLTDDAAEAVASNGLEIKLCP